jgi:uncharacterized membrane protein
MTHFSITAEIEAPPERVWAIMSDIERWPEWTPTVTSVERLDPGPLSIGSRARIRQPKLPPADWRITMLDQTKRTFTWITGGPGVRVTARHSVEPAAGQGRSRATLSIHFEGLFGPLVARVTRSLNERYLQLEADGLTKAATNPG